MNRKKKKGFTIIKKKMDNLHFIPNNILTNFFKELTKYKNDYQQYLNYIYRNYMEKIDFCPFHLKDVAKCLYSEIIQQNIPILKLDFLKIEFYIETRFLENPVIDNQTSKIYIYIYIYKIKLWNSSSM